MQPTETRLMRFHGTRKRDPAIEAWMKKQPSELGAMARFWFKKMRACGPEVREVLHDGYPTVCIGDAAFAYVGTFSRHMNVGFFRGAELSDPNGLLEGTGKCMRHVKLHPQSEVNAPALSKLITSAYKQMKTLVATEAQVATKEMTSPSTFATPDQYLAAVPTDKREALQKLRETIREAIPQAEECISYNLPSFRLDGKTFVSYGAAAKHCAFYAGSTARSFSKELAAYDASKGTIRFTPENPLPKSLVRRLIKERVKQRTAKK